MAMKTKGTLYMLISPLLIREGHEKILQSLSRLHMMTYDMVVPAVGLPSAASTINGRLVELCEHGYLYRFKLATKQGNSPWVYVMGSKGVKWLRDERELEVKY